MYLKYKETRSWNTFARENGCVLSSNIAQKLELAKMNFIAPIITTMLREVMHASDEWQQTQQVTIST